MSELGDQADALLRSQIESEKKAVQDQLAANAAARPRFLELKDLLDGLVMDFVKECRTRKVAPKVEVGSWFNPPHRRGWNLTTIEFYYPISDPDGPSHRQCLDLRVYTDGSWFVQTGDPWKRAYEEPSTDNLPGYFIPELIRHSFAQELARLIRK